MAVNKSVWNMVATVGLTWSGNLIGRVVFRWGFSLVVLRWSFSLAWITYIIIRRRFRISSTSLAIRGRFGRTRISRFTRRRFRTASIKVAISSFCQVNRVIIDIATVSWTWAYIQKFKIFTITSFIPYSIWYSFILKCVWE